jgi:hypothetical protein
MNFGFLWTFTSLRPALPAGPHRVFNSFEYCISFDYRPAA